MLSPEFDLMAICRRIDLENMQGFAALLDLASRFVEEHSEDQEVIALASTAEPFLNRVRSIQNQNAAKHHDSGAGQY